MSSARPILLPFLNHDVLAFIFNLNTYMLETEYGCSSEMVKLSALHTARHTSQVCRSWRHIILQSSAIWGNIIDVGTLSKASTQWFEEVMKRTGEAALSIYGQASHRPAVEMLISLLEVNWDRVRQLDVAMDAVAGHPAIHFDRFSNIFWDRQAPILEKFRVRVYSKRNIDEGQRTDRELFSGSAPLLRCFHSPHIHFNRNAPWIPQLVSVTLLEPLKISDGLNILANTPLLESLFIPSPLAHDDDAKTWKQDIQLPNLRILNLTSDIAGSLVWLSHIKPNSDCALSLTVREDSTYLLKSDNDTLQWLMEIISAYVEGYFHSNRPQKDSIDIYIGEHTVLFDSHETSDDDTDSEDRWRNPGFTFSIGSENAQNVSQKLDPAVVNMFFSTLARATLNNVHRFYFTVFHGARLPTTDVIIQTFRSLTSVTKMNLTPWALHNLNLLSDSANLFPHLTEVTIDYQRRVKDLDQILCVFLTRREEVGHPLQTLYKPDNSRPKGAKHWIFLKQFEGLSVISTGEGDDSDYSYDGESDSEDEGEGEDDGDRDDA